jgi:hypothetical protein
LVRPSIETGSIALSVEIMTIAVAPAASAVSATLTEHKPEHHQQQRLPGQQHGEAVHQKAESFHQVIPGISSLRAQRSNPCFNVGNRWIASLRSQ